MPGWMPRPSGRPMGGTGSGSPRSCSSMAGPAAREGPMAGVCSPSARCRVFGSVAGRFLSLFASLFAGGFHKSGKIEGALDARISQEVEGGHDDGAGFRHATEAGHQQDCRVPEKTPETQRYHTFNPARQRAAQLAHRPDPEGGNHRSYAEQIEEVSHLEGTEHVPR